MSQIEYLENDSELAAETRGGGPSVTYIVQTLRRYAIPILLTLVAATIAYLLLSVVYVLSRPVQRNTTMGFRVEFPGADQGLYPNGVRFSGSDIVDTPVLRAAYDANQLNRYMSFTQFSNSVVVLEANAALNELARQYESKLNNPRLTAVERDRLESEYQQKRDSLRKNEWALVLTTREGLTRVPPTVASKALSDILRFWADFASKTRQVLVHRVPLVSDRAIARLSTFDNDPLASFLALRLSARELRENIEALTRLPGAEVVRSQKRSASLRELELELGQLERGRIEYTINRIVSSGNIDRSRAIALIESQLEYDRRMLAAAEERVTVLRTALEDYSRDSRMKPASSTPAANDQVVPQVSDTFLAQVVTLAQNASDREFRERQVQEIESAALLAVPLRSAVSFEEQLLGDVRSAGGGGSVTSAEFLAERERVVRALGAVAQDLLEIRGVLSRSLASGGQIYTVTSPAIAVTERSVSLMRIALGYVLLMGMVTVAAIIAAFVHQRLTAQRSPDVAAAA